MLSVVRAAGLARNHVELHAEQASIAQRDAGQLSSGGRIESSPVLDLQSRHADELLGVAGDQSGPQA